MYLGPEPPYKLADWLAVRRRGRPSRADFRKLRSQDLLEMFLCHVYITVTMKERFVRIWPVPSIRATEVYPVTKIRSGPN